MGFMRDQAGRLIREKWANPSELAEELYAIWTGDQEVQLDGSVVINNTTGGPSLTINQGDVGDTAITINSNKMPPVTLPDIPPITNSFVTNFYGDGSGETFPAPQPPLTPTPGTGTPVAGGGGGGGFPGRVISGTGTSYQVAVYEAGLAGSPTTRTVRQLQIEASATIPAGTWAMVGKVGTSYFMQAPVWM